MPPIQKAPRAPACRMTRRTIANIYFYGELVRCIGADAADEWWQTIGNILEPPNGASSPRRLHTIHEPPPADVSHPVLDIDISDDLGLLFTDAAHVVLRDGRNLSLVLRRGSLSALF